MSDNFTPHVATLPYAGDKKDRRKSTLGEIYSEIRSNYQIRKQAEVDGKILFGYSLQPHNEMKLKLKPVVDVTDTSVSIGTQVEIVYDPPLRGCGGVTWH